MLRLEEMPTIRVKEPPDLKRLDIEALPFINPVYNAACKKAAKLGIGIKKIGSGPEAEYELPTNTGQILSHLLDFFKLPESQRASMIQKMSQFAGSGEEPPITPEQLAAIRQNFAKKFEEIAEVNPDIQSPEELEEALRDALVPLAGEGPNLKEIAKDLYGSIHGFVNWLEGER